MRHAIAWKDERGYVAPIFLAVVSVMLMLGWVAVGIASTHFVSAARQTRDIQAGQLARAGVEAALAEIDQNKVPRERITGQEETGTYEVSITPTGRGTYTVVSTGKANNQTRTITAEVAPPPKPFAILAGGNVKVSNSNGISLGGSVIIDGDVNAGGNVVLESSSVLLSIVPKVHVKGNVTAGGNVKLSATAVVASHAEVEVDGSVSAGGDVILEAKGYVPLLSGATIDIGGPVAHGIDRKLVEDTLFLGFIHRGPELKVQGVMVPPIREADTAYFEALVADLEAKGQMRQVAPRDACGTIREHTRISGDLKCGAFSKLKIENGAVVVVDGSVDVYAAEVGGVLYVRGAAEPDPTGHVDIDTLSLLELIGVLNPVSGGGIVAATGDIEVGKSLVAKLLSFGSTRTVLQVLALTTGPEDKNNDIYFGLGGLIEGLSGAKAAPLLLYAGGDGNIKVHKSELIDAIDIESLPMIAVAGGDVVIDNDGLANAVGQFTIKAQPDIWKYAPPFLQGMGRSWVMSWEWTD